MRKDYDIRQSDANRNGLIERHPTTVPFRWDSGRRALRSTAFLSVKNVLKLRPCCGIEADQ